ncbi:MAG: hypothetical protein AB8B61_00030 [Cyclobacteriaceae bacterium]
MSDEEKNLLIKSLKQATHYLEFGTGGSTVLALKHCKKVYSVESDKKWISVMRQVKYFKLMEKFRILRVLLTYIGPLKEWGHPTGDEEYRHLYEKYSSEIFKKIDAKKIDTVFIDGRFRVACTLKTIIECNKSVRILIHDWNRTQYHIVLEFLSIVEIKENMVLMKIKNSVNRTRINELYQLYKNNSF